MIRYAFIVAASENYLPGLISLLNSIEVHSPHTVIVVSYHLPHSSALTTPRSFEIKFIESQNIDDQVRATAIERFRIAVEIGEQYDAICLMDADMFLSADVELFFRIASKGFIVTGSNGMVIDFNKNYQERYGVDLNIGNYPYLKVHTTVPIFLGPQDLDWFDALYNSRRIDSWDDFLYLNILGIKMKKDERMICMPPYTFTGIHHWQMKPETAVFEKAGFLLSGTEEQVYMVHGQWWMKGWVEGLWDTMRRYFDAEGTSERGMMRTKKAIGLLQSKFDYYHNGGQNDRQER